LTSENYLQLNKIVIYAILSNCNKNLHAYQTVSNKYQKPQRKQGEKMHQ